MLATPPSPRSLHVNSKRPRSQRKKGSRGRPHSRSHSRSNSAEPEAEVEAGADSDASSSIRHPCSPSLPDDSRSSEADADSLRLRKGSEDSKDGEQPLHYLAMPESSVHRAPIATSPSAYASALAVTSNSIPDLTTEGERGAKGPGEYSDAVSTRFLSPILIEFGSAISLLIRSLPFHLQHITNVSTAVGVLVVSVPAAAVIRRIKVVLAVEERLR